MLKTNESHFVSNTKVLGKVPDPDLESKFFYVAISTGNAPDPDPAKNSNLILFKALESGFLRENIKSQIMGEFKSELKICKLSTNSYCNFNWAESKLIITSNSVRTRIRN